MKYLSLCLAFFCILCIKSSAGGSESLYNINNHSSTMQRDLLPETHIEKEIQLHALWFDFHEEITISTRLETPTRKAPSIVTVITAEEIKNRGIRTFSEILRMVPGFEILKTGDFGIVTPVVRGLVGAEKIRVMLDGHFVNDPRTGEAFIMFDEFPVDNIKRIEIIRGPGSAVYGENAFLAVINIITFDAKDIDGIRVRSGYGSFEAMEGSIVMGKTFGSFEVSGMLRYREKNGYDGQVDSDIVTVLDNALSPFGFPAASNAPGSVEDWRQELDLNMKLRYKDVYLEGLLINKRHGTFLGPQFALTDEDRVEVNYVFGEVGYQKTLNDIFTLKPRLYYDQFDRDSYIEALPENTHLPSDLDGDGLTDTIFTYPDGLIGHGLVIERIVGTEIPFDLELFDGNIITLGFEYRLIDQTNPRVFYNFYPPTLEPLPSIQNFTETFNWLKETTRRIWSVYIQDVWDITDTVNLTLGIRHDDYNEFESATSPRVGITWAFMENVSLKILYGEAFRPPDFEEMFTTNQPAIQGNEDLDPEEITTYEIGLNYQYKNFVTGSVNYFYNDIEDLIVRRVLPTTQNTARFENFGDAYVQGIELETKLGLSETDYLYFNYTFQDPQDDDGHNLPFVAKHKGNFGVNYKLWKYINTNINTFVSGKRYRETDDTREDLPSYALVDLSVLGKGFFRTMEVQGTVFNMLDKDYEDPGPISIEDDLPRPGRTFFIGFSYQF